VFFVSVDCKEGYRGTASFGGRKADYLERLNQKLTMKIAIGSANFTNCLAKAA